MILLNSELKIIKWDYKMEDNTLEKVLQRDDDSIQKILSKWEVEKRIILRTCNRFEIYYHTDVMFDNDDFPKADFIYEEEAIKHLLRVSSGLESMSVGEHEILRQIKESLENAQKVGRTDKFLSMIFQKALKVGKEVRETTEISHGKVSIPSIMIDQIEKKGLMNGKKIGVLGTGKMAATIVKYLRKNKSAKITIYGRNEEAGRELSELFKVNFKKTLDIPFIIEDCQVVVTATSSKTPLIGREVLDKISKKILLVDISNPKNIEENYNNNQVELINLDVANHILQENRKRKERDIEIAEKIIESEITKIYAKLAESEIEGYISAIYTRSRNVLNDELDRYRKSVENGTNEMEALEMMGNSIISKILAPETLTLKKMVRESKTESVRDFLSSAMDYTNSEISSIDVSAEDPKGDRSRRDRSRQLYQKP
jgi:glutamyl-tRNA reductase